MRTKKINWTAIEDLILISLISQRFSAQVISEILHRTPGSIYFRRFSKNLRTFAECRNDLKLARYEIRTRNF